MRKNSQLVAYGEMQVEVPASTPIDETKIVASWLWSKESERTQIMYRGYAEEFFHWFFNPEREPQRYSLKDVTLYDLQAYQAYVKQRHPKETTQALKMAALKSLMTFMRDAGFIDYNPGILIKLPKPPEELAERVLTLPEVYKLIDTADKLGNQRNYVMIVLLYASAIRCEELCNLQWKDCRPLDESGTILVHGKGNKTRTIYLHPRAWELLLALKPMEADPLEYVFFSRQVHVDRAGLLSRRLDESTVWRIVTKIATVAGFKASVHYLRHTHISHIIDEGKVHIAVLMRTTGHTTFRAMNRYIHLHDKNSSSTSIKL